MRIKVCAFTKKGKETLEYALEKCETWNPIRKREEESLEQWVQDGFYKRLPFLFVGAAGIAVRMIAPFVSDKLTDSPVLVMDEKGEYVIPILAGHVGGANRLACELAKKTGAQAVITTATDVENVFSVDVFAMEQGLYLENRRGIQAVSMKLLEGKSISVSVEEGLQSLYEHLPKQIEKVAFPPNRKVDLLITHQLIEDKWKKESTLILRPKTKVLGIGCKKGKSFEELKSFVEKNAGEHLEKDLLCVASIDRKKNEEGIEILAQYYHVPYFTYTTKELLEVRGEFTESDFVQEVTGVSNVCERAAIKGTNEKGRLIIKKIAKDGMTLAVAKIE